MSIIKPAAAILLTFLTSLAPAVSMAALMSLNATGTGSIAQRDIYSTSGQTRAYVSSNPLQELLYDPADPLGSVKVTSLSLGYLLFDVSAFSGVAESATIDFNLLYPRAANPNLTVTGLTLFQAQNLSNVPPGTETYTVYDAIYGTPEQQAGYARLSTGYNAIGSGTPLGTLGNISPVGQYSVTLTTTALDLINAASGLIGFGLTWTPTPDIATDPDWGDYETGGDRIAFNATPTLTLTSSAATVPTPGTLGLVLAASLLLLQGRRNRSRDTAR